MDNTINCNDSVGSMGHPPHPNDMLTEEQQQKLAHVAKQVRNGGPDGPPLTHPDGKDPFLVCDHYLLRFLRARQWDVEKALLMLRNHYAWRVEKDVSRIYNEPEENLGFDVDHLKRFYQHGYHGCDKKGRTVYIEKAGALDASRLLTDVTPEQVITYFTRGYEVTLRERLPASSLTKGRVIDRGLTILDLNGLGFRTATHTMGRKILKQIVAVSADNYPELLGEMIIINAPRVFSMAWSAIKPMLDEATVAKIKIYSHPATDVLEQLMAKDDIPEMYGGTCTCPEFATADTPGCLFSNKGPWNNKHIMAQLRTPEDVCKAYTSEGAKRALTDVSPPLSPKSICVSIEDESEQVDNNSAKRRASLATDAEVMAAKTALDELVAQHAELESTHMATLNAWADESKSLIEEIGRHAVERAQGFYDSRIVKESTLIEVEESKKQFELINSRYKVVLKKFKKAESAFHAFLLKNFDADVDEDEWVLMCENITHTRDMPKDKMEKRYWVVESLGEKLYELQKVRDVNSKKYLQACRDAEMAKKRFLDQEAKHSRCTWKCSTQRSKPFYEARIAHSKKAERQIAEIKKIADQENESRIEYEKIAGAKAKSEALKLDDFYIENAKGGDAEDDFFSADETSSEHSA